MRGGSGPGAIRGVCFDALGTLVRVRHGSVGGAYAEGVRDFETAVGLPPRSVAVPEPAAIDAQFRCAFKKNAQLNRDSGIAVGGEGAASRDAFWLEVVLEALGLARTSPDSLRIARHVVNYFGTPKAFEVLDGARESLLVARWAVAPVSGRVVVVTNNDDRMAHVLEGHGIGVGSGLLDAIVTSFDAPQKPQPDGILAALGLKERAIRRAGDVWVHVGDSDDDMAAAAAANVSFHRCDPRRGVDPGELRQFLRDAAAP